MSRAVGRRIDSINGTARRVMSGDLSERIPTYGSGDDCFAKAVADAHRARIELADADPGLRVSWYFDAADVAE